jgi:hypothetical protein
MPVIILPREQKAPLDEAIRLINQNPYLSSHSRLDAIFHGCDIAGEFFRKILMLLRDRDARAAGHRAQCGGQGGRHERSSET